VIVIKPTLVFDDAGQEKATRQITELMGPETTKELHPESEGEKEKGKGKKKEE
jgi:hypothetical protein